MSVDSNKACEPNTEDKSPIKLISVASVCGKYPKLVKLHQIAIIPQTRNTNPRTWQGSKVTNYFKLPIARRKKH